MGTYDHNFSIIFLRGNYFIIGLKMILEPKNLSGRSADGGGFDYQAKAWVLVAAKILAQESLNWVESGCNQEPISIRMETGSGRG